MLEHHKAPITFLHIQQNQLVTAAADGTVTLWDYPRREAQRTFNVDARHCVMRGNILLTAGATQHTILAWDLRSPQIDPVAKLVGHTGSVKEMQQSGEFLHSCSADGSVRTWDLQFAEEDVYSSAVQLQIVSKATYTCGAPAANCFVFFGLHLLVGHGDGNVRVYKSTSLHATWPGHTAAITCVLTMPSGVIGTGSQDGTVRLWQGLTGQCTSVLKHKTAVQSMMLRGDSLFVLPIESREVVCWNIKTGKQRHFEGHAGVITGMRVTLLHLYTSSQDRTLRRFDIRRGHCENVFIGHETAVNLFKLRGTMLISAESNGNICVWDVLQHDLETAEDANQEAEFLQEELNYESREASTYLSVQDLNARAEVLQISKSAPIITADVRTNAPVLFASSPNPATPAAAKPTSLASSPSSESAPFSSWTDFFVLCQFDRASAETFAQTMCDEGMELQQIMDLNAEVLRELQFSPEDANAVLAVTHNARLVRKGNLWRLETR